MRNCEQAELPIRISDHPKFTLILTAEVWTIIRPTIALQMMIFGYLETSNIGPDVCKHTALGVFFARSQFANSSTKETISERLRTLLVSSHFP